MEQKYSNLKSLIDELAADVEKFAGKGNKSAGLRIRKAMLEIKDLAQQIRKDVLEAKKA